jgi:hypothetical protein
MALFEVVVKTTTTHTSILYVKAETESDAMEYLAKETEWKAGGSLDEHEFIKDKIIVREPVTVVPVKSLDEVRDGWEGDSEPWGDDNYNYGITVAELIEDTQPAFAAWTFEVPYEYDDNDERWYFTNHRNISEGDRYRMYYLGELVVGPDGVDEHIGIEEY